MFVLELFQIVLYNACIIILKREIVLSLQSSDLCTIYRVLYSFRYEVVQSDNT